MNAALRIVPATSATTGYSDAVKTAIKGPGRPRVCLAAPASKPGALGVVAQIRVAARRENRLATLAGALFGGFVPLATFLIAHYSDAVANRDTSNPQFWINTVLIAGGLMFSFGKVNRWATRATKRKIEGFGFTLLTEGVMTFCDIAGLRLAALVVLIVINAIATGVVLARDEQA